VQKAWLQQHLHEGMVPPIRTIQHHVLPLDLGRQARARACDFCKIIEVSFTPIASASPASEARHWLSLRADHQVMAFSKALRSDITRRYCF